MNTIRNVAAWVILAGMCVGMSFSAKAATIEATVVNLIAYGRSDMSIDGGSNWTRPYAGSISMTRTGGTSPIELLPDATNFVTFCIEPREGISAGQSYTWEVEPVSEGTTSIGGMGEAKAELVKELIGREYAAWGSTLTNVRAAAIQIAIWEIVEENSGSLNVQDGNTRFRNGSISNLLDVAQTMLNALDGTGTKAQYLFALTNPTAQDILVMAVPQSVPDVAAPEPATFAMFGMGLLALGVIRRKRQTARLN